MPFEGSWVPSTSCSYRSVLSKAGLSARGSGEEAAATPVGINGVSRILAGEVAASLLLKVSGVELLAEGELLGT